MGHEERNAVAAIAANLGFVGFLAWRLSALAEAGRLDGPDALAVWARTVLSASLAGMVLLIALMILANVAFAVATRDRTPSFLVDERDRAIGAKGGTAALAGGSVGFLVGVVLLALGLGATTALNVMLAGFSLGHLIGDGARLWLYRRGL